MEKKRKAEDKRSKRREKKDQPDTGESGAPMLDQPLDGYADDDETGQATSDATS